MRKKAYRTRLHVFLEIAAWLCLLVSFGIAIYGMNVLPDTIAIHFTLDGAADGYGSPGSLLLMPIIMTLCVGGISLAAHILNPEEQFNMPFRVNESNKILVYRDMCTMLFCMNLEIALFTLYLEIKSFGQNGEGILPVTGIYIALMALTIVGFCLKAYRNNRRGGDD